MPQVWSNGTPQYGYPDVEEEEDGCLDEVDSCLEGCGLLLLLAMGVMYGLYQILSG